MDVKTTIPISEARRRFFEINDEVQKPGKHYTFTEKGRPKSVLMSAEEYESWMETFEVMRDFPNLKNDIREVEKDIESGNYKNFITLEEYLEKEGIKISHGKLSVKKAKDVIRSLSKTKSRKKSKKNPR